MINLTPNTESISLLQIIKLLDDEFALQTKGLPGSMDDLDDQLDNVNYFYTNNYIFRLIKVLNDNHDTEDIAHNPNQYRDSINYIITLIETFKGSRMVIKLLQNIPGLTLVISEDLATPKDDVCWYNYNSNGKLECHIVIDEIETCSDVAFIKNLLVDVIKSLLIVDIVTIRINKISQKLYAEYSSIILFPLINLSSNNDFEISE